MANFTFKREEKAKGLMRVIEGNRGSTIKLEGKVVGSISYKRNENKYVVMLHVKKDPTKEEPCLFKNVVLGARFDSDNAARMWLNEADRAQRLQTIHPLHQLED